MIGSIKCLEVVSVVPVEMPFKVARGVRFGFDIKNGIYRELPKFHLISNKNFYEKAVRVMLNQDRKIRSNCIIIKRYHTYCNFVEYETIFFRIG